MPLANLTADALDTLEPQRQSNFEFTLVVPGMNTDVLRLAVQSMPLPKEASGIIEAYHGNERRKFAGLPTYEDLTAVFHDYINNDVAGEIRKWRQRVYNPANGKIGWARNYKAQGIILQHGPNGEWERPWQVRGVWPSNFDPGDMDKTAEDMVRISVTLTIDKAVMGEIRASGNIGTD
jgi:hypothetical protein